jgi:hypothetical protein
LFAGSDEAAETGACLALVLRPASATASTRTDTGRTAHTGIANGSPQARIDALCRRIQLRCFNNRGGVQMTADRRLRHGTGTGHRSARSLTPLKSSIPGWDHRNHVGTANAYETLVQIPFSYDVHIVSGRTSSASMRDGRGPNAGGPHRLRPRPSGEYRSAGLALLAIKAKQSPRMRCGRCYFL